MAFITHCVHGHVWVAAKHAGDRCPECEKMIDQAWKDVRWSQQYVEEWRMMCLLWFAIGLMIGAVVAWSL